MNHTKMHDRAKQNQLAKQLRTASEVEQQAHYPSSYELNVAVKDASGQAGRAPYHHLFATHARSVTNADQAAALLTLLRAKFPEPQYHVSLTAQYAFGRTLEAS